MVICDQLPLSEKVVQMKKQVQVLKVMAFAVLAVTASVTLPAAMLDMAGTDMTVSDVTALASYDGVTNSSATAATLTFNIADDQSYGMTIGGNLALAKTGVVLIFFLFLFFIFHHTFLFIHFITFFFGVILFFLVGIFI